MCEPEEVQIILGVDRIMQHNINNGKEQNYDWYSCYTILK